MVCESFGPRSAACFGNNGGPLVPSAHSKRLLTRSSVTPATELYRPLHCVKPVLLVRPSGTALVPVHDLGAASALWLQSNRPVDDALELAEGVASLPPVHFRFPASVKTCT